MSKSATLDYRGSPLCAFPLERHPFHAPANAFDCAVCRRPRALHYDDGFIPSQSPSRLSTDPAARYRGPHPRWSRPGHHIRD